MDDATCPACGGQVPLATGYRPRVWCSESCRQWARNHPGEVRRIERVCVICNADISALQYKAEVCSAKCRNVRDGQDGRQRRLAIARVCVFCGGEFRSAALATKCCSLTCAQRLRHASCERDYAQWREQQREQRWRTRFPKQVCPVCGVTYQPTSRPTKQKTCGRAGCRRLLRNPRLPVLYAPLPIWMRRPVPDQLLPPLKLRWYAGFCADCGSAFIHDRRLMFCSNVCAERHARRIGRARRRARLRNAYVADVWRRKIFERDKWRCKLCGKPVARTKEVPHPKAPVLDHIIPLAVGGTHEPANVQCAHFLCNSLKSAGGGGEQLLLIG